jgi:hypothetical protein
VRENDGGVIYCKHTCKYHCVSPCTIIIVRSLTSIGQEESPEAIIETRSLGPKLLAKSTCLQNCRRLPVFQLAVCTKTFYLVITDNQGPTTQLFSETETLPPLMDGPSYKAHYPFQLSCYTLNLRVSSAVCASNKFFSILGMV